VFSKEIATITGALALGEMDRSSPGFEVFATSWDDTNKVFAVRGDGSFLPGWPQNPDPGTPQKGYWADGSAMDVDGDGRCELFAPAKNGNLYAWHWNGTPLGASAAFKTGFPTYMRCSPSFANLDADPYKEIIFGAPNGSLYIWKKDGTNFGTFPKTPGTVSYGNTAVGDVNKDGILDVVYVTEGGAVNIYNTKTGNQLPGWPKAISMKSNPKTPSPALADFDNDGFLEIVIANNHVTPTLSAVQVYNYQGNLLPGWPIIVGGFTSESSPIVADVSGDGVPDILFGNEGGLLYGWNKNGVNLPGFPLTVGDFIRSVPVADDVDGDGSINLVLTGWDKNVYIWNFTAPFNQNAAQWPMLKHDVQRSGLYKYRIDSPTDVGPGDVPAGPPPAAAFLAQNTPNPFNPTTKIAYGIPANAGGAVVPVRLEVFDASGRVVRHLLSGAQTPGQHAVLWDGRDDGGQRVGSGIFFYRLQVAAETLTRKMLLLK
jgi:WD40 repeat protein